MTVLSKPVAPGVPLSSSAAASRGRYRFLGTYRFLLATLVLLHHFQHLLEPDQQAAVSALNLGEIAVTIFFVISGFIVAEACDSFYAGRPGAFLTNRVLRIAPPFLGALAVSVLAYAVMWNQDALRFFDRPLVISPLDPTLLARNLLSIFPLSRYGVSGPAAFLFLPVVWTLRLELAFYLAAFLAYLAVDRLRGASRAERRRIVGWCAFPAGFLLFLVYVVFGKPGMFASAPFFMLGMAGYFVLQRSTPTRILLAAASAAAAVWAFAIYPGRHVPDVSAARWVVFAILLTMPFLLATTYPEAAWIRRLDGRLGDLSYSLYLNHYIVGVALYSLFDERGVDLLAVGFAASLLLSMAMKTLIETPMKSLRTRIRRHSL
ncbi:MAG: acyltransferase family protein [Burkholderiaceae bacterium]